MAAFPPVLSSDLKEHYNQMINRRLDKFLNGEEKEIAPLLIALESIVAGTSSESIPETLATRVTKIKKMVEKPAGFVTKKEYETPFKEMALSLVTKRIEDLKKLKEDGKIIYQKEDLIPHATTTEFPSLADQGLAWDFRIFENDLNSMLFCAFGNPQKQIAILEDLASENIADAQFALGNIYEAGTLPVQKDSQKAYDYYFTASKQGHPGAQFKLACFYTDGIIVNQDSKTALTLYQLSATNGFPPAQFSLGLLYLGDNGIPQDNDKAFFWFNKTVDSGDNRALLSLGICYENGTGVSPNPVEAFNLYKRAVEKKVPKAKIKVALSYYNGVGIQQNFKKAARWFRSGAHEGDSKCRYYLGVCYSSGEGVNQHHEKAFRCYQIAAKAGERCAYVELGGCYQNAIGVEKNLVKAKKWFERSAETGSKHGQYGMAEYYGEVLEELTTQQESLINRLEELKFALECLQDSPVQRSSLNDAIAKTQTEIDRCQVSMVEHAQKMQNWLKLAADQGHEEAIEVLNTLEDASQDVEVEGHAESSQQQ